MENMDLLKIEEERGIGKDKMGRSFNCGICDCLCASKKEWEEHRRSVHKVFRLTENEAELYQAPEHVDTRIIGKMEAELNRFGIEISIYDIIELDLETLE